MRRFRSGLRALLLLLCFAAGPVFAFDVPVLTGRWSTRLTS